MTAVEKKPGPVSNSVLATLYFTKAKKPLGYGNGFVVRFSVPPKIGDILQVDQNSIRKISKEELHRSDWKVVEVRHDVNLDVDAVDGCPLTSLYVTVHPKT